MYSVRRYVHCFELHRHFCSFSTFIVIEILYSLLCIHHIVFACKPEDLQLDNSIYIQITDVLCVS